MSKIMSNNDQLSYIVLKYKPDLSLFMTVPLLGSESLKKLQILENQVSHLLKTITSNIKTIENIDLYSSVSHLSCSNKEYSQ